MGEEDAKSVQLGIDCLGSGAPTLIFVHGGFCDRHDWQSQVNRLSGRFNVIALDLPGHGESALPARADVEALARSVGKVVARHGQGGVILVGHSLGCRVILEAFRQASAGIIGMVLTEGGLIAAGDADQAVDAFKKQLDTVGFLNLMRPLFEGMFTAHSDPNLRLQALDRLDRVNVQFAEELLLNTVRWDASEAARVLPLIDLPTLIVDSTSLDENFNRTSLVPGARTPWMELVLRHVPEAEIRIVPGVGHFLMIEASEVVSDHIGAFANRVTQARSGTRPAC